MIKKFTLLVAIACFAFSMPVLAQEDNWHEEVANEPNFYNVQKAFYEYRANEAKSRDNGVEEDGPEELFHRWEAFMLPRVYPSGNPIDPTVMYNKWLQYKQLYKPSLSRATPEWKYASPDASPANYGGDGRVNFIKMQPGNKKIIWAGTPEAGLWKSTDGGKTWASNTDQLPVLGVSDIVINPKNTNEMYIATGDGLGYAIGNGTFWGGTYSMGVMKSTDGGASWQTTGLNFKLTESRQVFHLYMHPDSTNLVIAVANNGIWRTKDGGKTWVRALNANVRDIKQNVTRSNELYAAGNQIYKSVDTGRTWVNTNANTGMVPDAYALAVTPANDSLIYAVSAVNGNSQSGVNQTLFKSLDRGKTWSNVGVINAVKSYGWYSSAFAVSPTNANFLIYGGLDLIRSGDGGKTWSVISGGYNFGSSNYVHPDHHCIIMSDKNDTIYESNDGGIFVSYDKGNTWKQSSSGIHAFMIYKIGSSPTDANTYYIGAQDNGVNRHTQSKWDRTQTGDGMGCIVSNDDPNTAVVCVQYGTMYKTTNGGGNFQYITPAAGNWTSPLFKDPEDNNTIYYGGPKLYKSLDMGSSWTVISTSLGAAGNINKAAIAPGDANTIYVSLGSEQLSGLIKLYKTTDGGKTWTSISKGLPVGSNYLTDIAVDRFYSNKLWVSFTGYNDSSKLYVSEDGGSSWKNASGNLPNLPVNCIAQEYSDLHGMYVGTEIGVYYQNDQTGGWVPFNNGMPNVIVSQLEVLPAIGKIRAATFGRGVWEADLQSNASSIARTEALGKGLSIFPNPASSTLNISIMRGTSENPTVRVYNMMGMQVAAYASTFDSNGSMQINVANLAAGMYLVNVDYNSGTISRKVQIMK